MIMGVSFSSKTFESLYGVSAGNDKNGTAIQFASQDATYRVYIPGADTGKSSATTDSAGNLTLKLEQDHIRHGLTQTDDVSKTELVFDDMGNITSCQQDGSIDDGGAITIPKWIPKALDITVELLGALGALESAGISEAAAQEVVADITTFCDTFNKVSAFVAKWTDDGGRLNFPAVICHDMNKACCSVTIDGTAATPPAGVQALTFDANAFGDAIAKQPALQLDTTSNHGWDGDQLKCNDIDGKWDYEVWRPDTSLCRNGAAIIVSCKIDQLRGGKDDHVVLIASFNRDGHFIAGQGSAQSIKHDASGVTPMVAADQPSAVPDRTQSDNNLVYHLGQALATALTEAEGTDGKDAGLEYMNSVSQAVLHSMQQAIKLK